MVRPPRSITFRPLLHSDLFSIITSTIPQRFLVLHQASHITIHCQLSRWQHRLHSPTQKAIIHPAKKGCDVSPPLHYSITYCHLRTGFIPLLHNLWKRKKNDLVWDAQPEPPRGTDNKLHYFHLKSLWWWGAGAWTEPRFTRGQEVTCECELPPTRLRVMGVGWNCSHLLPCLRFLMAARLCDGRRQRLSSVFLS